MERSRAVLFEIRIIFSDISVEIETTITGKVLRSKQCKGHHHVSSLSHTYDAKSGEEHFIFLKILQLL